MSFATCEPAITADQLVEAARKLKGVPWRHQGRSKCGVDCIGLVTLSFKGAGIDLPKMMSLSDRRDYGRAASPDLLKMVRENCEQISAPVDGCLILMRFPGEKHPRHFGIYANGNVIHADSRAGHVVEHGYRGPWQRCQHSLWKIPGVLYAP